MILSQLSGFWLLALVPIGVLAVAGGFYRLSRKKARPLEVISGNLETVANQIEVDLTQLQLEDSYGLLSQGWNRLISEVEQARAQLESMQVQRQAQETLGRYQTNWVTELLNRMPQGLLLISEDLTVTFANVAAERMLGRQAAELQKGSVKDIFGTSLNPNRLPSGSAMERSFDADAGGHPIRIKAVKTYGQGGDGQIALFLSDLSQQKQQEKARDQFLYHITHELRTPLTNIRAYAETLSEGVLEDPESLRECYNVIVGETDRLSRLVEDILSVSQLEAGSARMETDDVQTARLVRQVVEDMQAQADEKNIELTLSLPPKVPVVRGDKGRLAVVMTNLVGNAIKYTPRGGKVEVSCVEEGSRVLISVRDTGLGIAPDEQESIFEKFYRAKDDRVAELPGTGLGLAIARETVRAHGGTIELESEPNKGSTFTVCLPIGKATTVRATKDV